MVLVHGFGSSLTVWDSLAARLAPSHRVIRLDLPGFGRSSRYEGDYRRAELARRVLELMDHLDVERASLVAHSMGSAVALTAALEAPDRIEQLVLVAPWLYEDQVPWALRDARQPGVGELIFGLWWTEHLDGRFRVSFADPDAFVSEGMLERARAQLSRPGSRAAALAVIRGLELEELDPLLGQVTAPAQVVQCDSDPVARPEFGARLVSELPDAELRSFAGCGHFPMVERAAAFESLVATVLAERASR